MGMLNQQVHEDCLAVVQVSSHTNVPDPLLLSHQVEKILCLIVSFEGLLMIVALLMLC